MILKNMTISAIKIMLPSEGAPESFPKMVNITLMHGCMGSEFWDFEFSFPPRLVYLC
jgi:hypothetical protein